jgi:hypothetical protein
VLSTREGSISRVLLSRTWKCEMCRTNATILSPCFHPHGTEVPDSRYRLTLPRFSGTFGIVEASDRIPANEQWRGHERAR